MRDLFDEFLEELRRREAAARGEDPDASDPRRARRVDPDADDGEDGDGEDACESGAREARLHGIRKIAIDRSNRGFPL
jgi:hypothetical protein